MHKVDLHYIVYNRKNTLFARRSLEPAHAASPIFPNPPLGRAGEEMSLFIVPWRLIQPTPNELYTDQDRSHRSFR